MNKIEAIIRPHKLEDLRAAWKKSASPHDGLRSAVSAAKRPP